MSAVTTPWADLPRVPRRRFSPLNIFILLILSSSFCLFLNYVDEVMQCVFLHVCLSHSHLWDSSTQRTWQWPALVPALKCPSPEYTAVNWSVLLSMSFSVSGHSKRRCCEVGCVPLCSSELGIYPGQQWWACSIYVRLVSRSCQRAFQSDRTNLPFHPQQGIKLHLLHILTWPFLVTSALLGG